jgi:hypothetical protein
MTKTTFVLAGLLAGSTAAFSADHTVHTWKKTHLSNHFWSEGANVGDFNHDGKLDVVSGPYWWEGPDFKTRHEYMPTKRKSPAGTAPFKIKKADGTEETVEGFEGALGTKNAYADNFFAFTHDFNGDGWDDVLVYGFPGLEATWYENPKGKKAADGSSHWPRHVIFDVVDNESPTFGDVTGDGKPEIICSSKGFYGYASPDWSDPVKPWVFHPISPNNKYHKFTHGLGVGDVNGDGKADLLEKSGWWQQPASLAGDPVWKYHPAPFSTTEGSAQMYTFDVNADGRLDVVTALAAHNYGLAWYEQLTEKGTNGSPKFKQHLIMGKKPADNKYGVVFSQLHAVDFVDMDGDGLKDIVTGKRFWAHGSHGDSEPSAPAVLYWFKLVRNADKSIDWIPYLIDNDSGVGTQVLARDVNGDGLPDIVVGNKKGTFVHLQSAQKVSREEWEKAQPKPFVPPQQASAK